MSAQVAGASALYSAPYQVGLHQGAGGLVEYIAGVLTVGHLEHQHQHQCGDHCLLHLCELHRIITYKSALLIFSVDTNSYAAAR